MVICVDAPCVLCWLPAPCHKRWGPDAVGENKMIPVLSCSSEQTSPRMVYKSWQWGWPIASN